MRKKTNDSELRAKQILANLNIPEKFSMRFNFDVLTVMAEWEKFSREQVTARQCTDHPEIKGRRCTSHGVVYQGIKYRSVRALAEDLGFKASRLQNCYFVCGDIDLAVEKYKNMETEHIQISMGSVSKEDMGYDDVVKAYRDPIYPEKLYSSFRQLLYAYDAEYTTIRYRLIAGYSLEEALLLTDEDRRPVSGESQVRYGFDIEKGVFCISGENGTTLQEVCRKFHVSAISYRIACMSGMEPEAAMKAAAQIPSEYMPVTILGKEYRSFQDLRKDLRVSLVAIYRRMLDEKLSISFSKAVEDLVFSDRHMDQVIRTDGPDDGYVREYDVYIDESGRTFRSLTAMCRAHKMAVVTFRRKRARGYTVDRIFKEAV